MRIMRRAGVISGREVDRNGRVVADVSAERIMTGQSGSRDGSNRAAATHR